MRKFYLNFTAIMVITVLGLVLIDYLSMTDGYREILAYLTNSSSYIKENVGSDEIKPYIERVKRQDGATRLIIGDSVCRQMFENLQELNNDFCIAGTNASINMTGQNILAKEFLDNHPDAADVFLIVLPTSLRGGFNITFGYQYMVMPFAETNTLGLLDKETIEIMESVYGEFFMKPSVVRAIDLSGINRKLYLNFLNEHASDYELQSPYALSEQYIAKICDMCVKKGVNFHMYPCPVSSDNVEYMEQLRESFEESALYEINPDYMESIYYYDAKETSDGVHFGKDYAYQEHFNEIIEQMLQGKEILEMLKLE